MRIGAFARFRTCESLACPHVSNVGVVARGGNPIALQLPTHSRRRTPQPAGNITNREPLDAPPKDKHAFLERQEPFTDPMRLALHIQTVPMSLRSEILARSHRPLERVRPLRQTLPVRFETPTA